MAQLQVAHCRMRPAAARCLVVVGILVSDAAGVTATARLVRKTGKREVIGVRVANDLAKPAGEELAGTYRMDYAAKTIVLVPSLQLQGSPGSSGYRALQ